MEVRLQGYQVGFEDVGQGTPLLLMHAFPLSQAMFKPQRTDLCDVARVLTFDVPGVGRSERREVSIEDIADIAAAVLDERGIDRAVVGGVSMGGYASFAFARRHPGRLRGLILANTRAAADSDEARANRKAMAEKALREGSGPIVEAMLPRLLGATTRKERPDVTQRVRAIAESVAPQTIAMLLGALGNRRDSSDLLGSFEAPTLVIAGEEDPLAPPQEMEEWAAEIPGAQFTTIAGAGHLANMEQPEAFNGAVGEFLRHIDN